MAHLLADLPEVRLPLAGNRDRMTTAALAPQSRLVAPEGLRWRRAEAVRNNRAGGRIVDSSMAALRANNGHRHYSATDTNTHDDAHRFRIEPS